MIGFKGVPARVATLAAPPMGRQRPCALRGSVCGCSPPPRSPGRCRWPALCPLPGGRPGAVGRCGWVPLPRAGYPAALPAGGGGTRWPAALWRWADSPGAVANTGKRSRAGPRGCAAPPSLTSPRARLRAFAGKCRVCSQNQGVGRWPAPRRGRSARFRAFAVCPLSGP